LAGKYAEIIREETRKLAIKTAEEGLKTGLSSDIILGALQDELDSINAGNGRDEAISLYDLNRAGLKNTEFIIDGLLPVGLTLFTGAQKMGKSWMLLDWAFHITFGLPLARRSVKKAGVLYYSLEDNRARCIWRLNHIEPPHSLELEEAHGSYLKERVKGTSGVMADIKRYGPRVVIIDTFGSFQMSNKSAAVKDGNDYFEMTEKTRELKEIADTMKVAIIAVHHTHKQSAGGSKDWTTKSMGSQALSAAADALIDLERERGADEAVLNVTGRDIKDAHIKIHMNDGLWEYPEGDNA
jgi:RecA-family ATPase